MEAEIKPGDLVRWAPGESEYLLYYGHGPFTVSRVDRNFIFITITTNKRGEVGFLKHHLELDPFLNAVRRRRHV